MHLTPAFVRDLFGAAWDAKATGVAYAPTVEGIISGLTLAGAFLSRPSGFTPSGEYAEAPAPAPVLLCDGKGVDAILNMFAIVGKALRTGEGCAYPVEPPCRLAAIKALRGITGCGLKAAKDAIDAICPRGTKLGNGTDGWY